MRNFQSPGELDRKWMLEALSLAQKRRGETSPNPAVGAIVVRNRERLSQGFHWAAGEPHAEVKALEGVEDPVGTTIYVTLEPCCHFGKTPPCTELLIQKKVKRVVFGILDPNPKVAGRGAEILLEKGIEVVQMRLDEIEEFYAPYSFWVKTGCTWLTGKLALTVDGKVSRQKGYPLKITGKRADEVTHLRRKRADLILTSEKTVTIDNPKLTARIEGQEFIKPVWVLDNHLKMSALCELGQRSQSITLLCDSEVDPEKYKTYLEKFREVLPMKTSGDLIVLSKISAEMGKRGFHEAWVEVGPRLFSAFVRDKSFQEVVLYRSKSVSGGPQGQEGLVCGVDPLKEFYQKKEERDLGEDKMETWWLR